MVLTGTIISNIALIGCGTAFIAMSAVWFWRGNSAE
jgi:hypothetical protein